MARLKSADMKKKPGRREDAYAARTWSLYVTYRGKVDEGLDQAVREAVSAACDGTPQPATWLRRMRVTAVEYDAPDLRRLVYELPNREVAEQCAGAAERAFTALSTKKRGTSAEDFRTNITDGVSSARVVGGKSESRVAETIQVDWHLHVTYEGPINTSLDAAVRRAVKDECVAAAACDSDYDFETSTRSLYISVPASAGEQCVQAAVRAYKNFLGAMRATKSRAPRPEKFNAGMCGGNVVVVPASTQTVVLDPPAPAKAARVDVRSYLDSLVWDNVPRLGVVGRDGSPGWLAKYLGAVDDQETTEAGRRFLIGAVARVYEPGCKVHVLVLSGPQGNGKSRALRALAEPWSMEMSPTSKSVWRDIHGAWLVEVDSADLWQRSAREFIDRTTDPSRRSRPVPIPRECVFVGTTNDPDSLQALGVTHVATGKIDVQLLVEDRDQLIAESVVAYRAGEAWWSKESLRRTPQLAPPAPSPPAEPQPQEPPVAAPKPPGRLKAVGDSKVAALGKEMLAEVSSPDPFRYADEAPAPKPKVAKVMKKRVVPRSPFAGATISGPMPAAKPKGRVKS